MADHAVGEIGRETLVSWFAPRTDVISGGALAPVSEEGADEPNGLLPGSQR
jgi:hypothetical protein